MFDYRVISFGPAMRRKVVAAGMAGGLLVTLTASAQAQFFGWWGSPPAIGVPPNAVIAPNEIFRMVTDRGYQIDGRLKRNGRVYLINVIDRWGSPQQLVIDAHEGNILQSFATSPPRPLASIPQPQLQSRADLGPQYSYQSSVGYPANQPQLIPGIGPAAGVDTRRSRTTKTQTATRETGGSSRPAHRTARSEVASQRPAAGAVAPQQPPAKVAPAGAAAAPQPSAAPKPARQNTEGPGYANGVPINPLD